MEEWTWTICPFVDYQHHWINHIIKYFFVSINNSHRHHIKLTFTDDVKIAYRYFVRWKAQSNPDLPYFSMPPPKRNESLGYYYYIIYYYSLTWHTCAFDVTPIQHAALNITRCTNTTYIHSLLSTFIRLTRVEHTTLPIFQWRFARARERESLLDFPFYDTDSRTHRTNDFRRRRPPQHTMKHTQHTYIHSLTFPITNSRSRADGTKSHFI